MKIEKVKADPDHSPTTGNIAAQVIMIHIEGTLDHNTGIDAATIETAHDDLAQPTDVLEHNLGLCI